MGSGSLISLGMLPNHGMIFSVEISKAFHRCSGGSNPGQVRTKTSLIPLSLEDMDLTTEVK